MKILFVVAKYYPYVGGAELLFQRLAEGLVERGHKVTVLTARLKGSEKTEIFNGVQIERISLPLLENPLLFSVFAIRRVIKTAKGFEIIHTASNYSGLAAFIGAKLRRKKIVLTCHEVLGNRWRLAVSRKLLSWIYQTIERLIISLPFDQYVSISKATNKDLIALGIPPEKTEVIYCGVDRGEFDSMVGDNGRDTDIKLQHPGVDFIYLYYGRPGITKGLPYLIEAVPLVAKKIPSSKLVMVLSSSPAKEYQNVKKKILERCLEEKISLVPSFDQREDLFSYIAKADCIVIPSLTEGFGFTTVEASALDPVVVATTAGSIPEVIFGNHVLVEPANSEALAEGICQAFCGEFDHHTQKEFSWDKMVQSYNVVYQRMTAFE
jgi:D-inositol-3-phosphate glycosyltransferase